MRCYSSGAKLIEAHFKTCMSFSGRLLQCLLSGSITIFSFSRYCFGVCRTSILPSLDQFLERIVCFTILSSCALLNLLSSNRSFVSTLLCFGGQTKEFLHRTTESKDTYNDIDWLLWNSQNAVLCFCRDIMRKAKVNNQDRQLGRKVLQLHCEGLSRYFYHLHFRISLLRFGAFLLRLVIFLLFEDKRVM